MSKVTQLPFPALVGLELAQQALLLLAVDPRLRGVVLSAPAGTGKSSLARGIRQIIGTDFVEIPASIDVENLLGGLDLEATLHTGEVTLQPGVLARAHGGVAYIDGINLLDDASANLLLSVLDEGEVRVEREGVSVRSPARFRLIASYDPAEGVPRRHLLDRVGMIAPLPGATDVANRIEVMRRNLLSSPEVWDEDVAFMRGVVAAARDQLRHVSIDNAQIKQLAVTALAYGVEGHRVDLFATRVARAAAAFELRDTVEEADLEVAMRLVILPRALHMPAPPPEDTTTPPPPPDAQSPDADEQQQTEDNNQNDEQPEGLPETLMPAPEQILEALENELPEMLETLSFAHMRRGRSGSRGATEGRRGRHIRSVPGDPSQGGLDVVATLRAAAPWQRVRERGHKSRSPVQIAMSDMRIKRYHSKAGALFCFVVDTSGSMALHRMRQAKGAVHKLLEKAYVNRDRVALIAFRGQQAELLLPPSQSVEMASRALDLLPTGGGTPLASALLLADDVAQQARMRGILQTVVILLTDGRANISLKEGTDPQTELKQIGQYLSAEGNIRVVVVDTKRSYLSQGEARQLATYLNGDYAYLPNANSDQIAEIATDQTRPE